ncbi:MAG: hypothetical protein KY442_02210 [Proteobacteria bacterium]|nr:hypothetical protein [Pseudomonadota bacterium]
MTSFAIPADHPSLPGHFPGRPLVPGVILLERVIDAVAAECLALGLERPLESLRLPQVKFLQPLLPGETARIELERIAASLRWRFRVLRGPTLLASGEVANAAPAGAATAAEPGQ